MRSTELDVSFGQAADDALKIGILLEMMLPAITELTQRVSENTRYLLVFVEHKADFSGPNPTDGKLLMVLVRCLVERPAVIFDCTVQLVRDTMPQGCQTG